MMSAPTLPVRNYKFPYGKIPQIGSRDLAYIVEDQALRPFYKYSPDLDSFENVINDKRKDETDRKLLVEVLREQYNHLDTANPTGDNIQKLLQNNTFTIVTAHQPSLFTGPLYYIYKIISTIRLTKDLSKKFPAHNFVPVFVTGGEDHDFEEINHIHLFGKTLTWNNEEHGATGMMKTESLTNVLEELEKIIGESEEAHQIFNLIRKTHTENEVYSNAVVQMLHELFKPFGLVVLNMNHAALKKQFIPVMQDELLHQTSSTLVNNTLEKLEEAGFSAQAVPREINLFYLRNQLRERIIFEDGVYKVLNSDFVFSEQEILSELEAHPEHFSPNVVLRPLYQEIVLPNLAYVGGGGELAYWLERKEQFEHFGINFPMLIRRNSVLWIDSASSKRMEKLEIKPEDLFQDTDHLIKQYVEQHAEGELSLSGEKEDIGAAFENIAAKAENIDPTLIKAIHAEKTRQLKVVEQLESRLARAEKQKHETAVNQIRSIREKLFPHNGLQERHDNFLPLYLKHGKNLFQILKEHLDPMNRSFIVIRDEN